MQRMESRQSQKLDIHLKKLHAHPQFEDAQQIIATLKCKGFQTVLAGGCVRDALLGQTPKDLDIATAAAPEVVEASFARTLNVGKAFGTIVVRLRETSFEVTTFRRDGPYHDGRHPESVEFSDAMEDARRRDFTINALFYDPLVEQVTDYVNGLNDLNLRLIRTVGEPTVRFGEDRLRLLRAARFVAQLGFKLDVATGEAMRDFHLALGGVAAERIFNEMKRLLGSTYVLAGLEVLKRSNLYRVVWPELGSIEIESLRKYLPFIDWENAFAAAMAECARPIIETRLRAWKAPRDSALRVCRQIVGAKTLLDASARPAARVKVLGSPEFAAVMQLCTGSVGGGSTVEREIAAYLKVANRLGTLPAPLINGHDLLLLGFKPGREMGLLLEALYDDQLEGGLTAAGRAVRLNEISLETGRGRGTDSGRS